MGHDGDRVADHGHVGRQAERFDEAHGAFERALEFDGEDRRRAVAVVFAGVFMARVRVESHEADPLDLRVAAAVFGQFPGGFHLMLHAQREGLQPDHHQVGVERRGAASQVAQPVDAAFDDEGRRTERLV